jgi:dihydroxy-acid dehydratase
MDAKFQTHKGPAIVADSYAQLKEIINDEDFPMTPDHVLVLRNAGPQGGPGMPEWGMIPMPKALLKHGHRDMVRLSDARMSGTSYGACVLHVAPESFVGGPLALIQTGDIIEMDIPNRTLNVALSDAELEQRRAKWQAPTQRYARGYGQMFANHVEQADKGCDFDFLRTDFGEPVPEPEIN